MNKNAVKNIIQIILGVTLTILGEKNIINEIFTGMGIALIIMAILQLIRIYKYNTDSDYQEKIDTEIADERNKYIRMKAWSWAGYMFVILAAVATIICMAIDQKILMYAFSYSVCAILILYYGSYLVLRNKY